MIESRIFVVVVALVSSNQRDYDVFLTANTRCACSVVITLTCSQCWILFPDSAAAYGERSITVNANITQKFRIP